MNNTDNQNPELATKIRRKYYWLLATLIFLGTMLVALGAGTAALYWHRPWSDGVTIILILGVWVAFKRVSRAYQEGRLFDAEGNLKRFRELRSGVHKDNGQSTNATASRRSSATLSAKDRARLAEIERKRASRQASKTDPETGRK